MKTSSKIFPLKAFFIFVPVYFLFAKAGLALACVNHSVSAVWLPTGLALAALLIWGSRLWPGVFAGAFLVQSTVQHAWGISMCTAFGDTLETLLAAGLVRRFAGGISIFERVDTTFKYFFLAAAGSTIGATWGVAGLCLEYHLPWSEFGATWTTWWLGSLVSYLIVAPFILLWLLPQRQRWRPVQIIECLCLLLLVFAICRLLFWEDSVSLAVKHLESLVIFPLLWSAFRFGLRGAASCSLVLCGSALWGTASGNGPFLVGNPNASLLLVQIYCGMMGMIALVVASIVIERHTAEEVLRENEERWEHALEGAQEGVWDWDRPARKVLFSKRWKEMLGYTEAEIGTAFEEWSSRVHPDELEAVVARLDEYLQKPRERGFSFEFRMRCKDGSWKWILTRGMVLTRNAAGEPKRVIGTHADLTERKQMELKLRESEERYRLVVQNQTDTICRFSPDGTFLFVNEMFCRLFGKSHDELVGQKWHPVPVPEDVPVIEAQLRRLSPDHTSVMIENRVFDGDGQVRWMQFANRGLFDAAGKLVEIQSVGRDITEGKKVEARLAILARAMEGSTELICITDIHDQFTFANRAFLECYGYTEAEILGRTPEVLIAPGNPPGLLAEILAQTRKGGWRGEVLDRRKDGSEFLIALSTSKITDAQGVIIGLIGIARDITAGKQIETALRHSEERYRSLAESSPDAIFILNRAARVHYVNHAATRWLGKPAAELFERSQAEMFPPEMARELEKSIQQVFATGELVRKEQRHSSQEITKWTEARVMPLRNEHGVVVFVMGILRDLTEQRQAEESFKESEAWSQKVLATVMDGFFRLDLEGRFLDVNEAYCRMIGYQREELLQMRISDISLYAPSPEHYKAESRRIISLGGARFESRHRCKNGSFIEFEVVSSHFKLRESYIFSFLRDITERKQLERELSEISATERQRIGYDLHDGLGQELAGIAFKTKVLEENLATTSAEQMAEAAEIVSLLNNAISQTRSLARMLAPVEVEADGFQAAMENLARETKNLFRVECTYESMVDTPLLDAKTGMTLFRIAQESIHNAVNRGGAERIDIYFEPVDSRLCLSIRDNGKGFLVAQKPKTGMGLRIMKYRAGSVGGSIIIDSSIGGGTKVKCFVPIPTDDMRVDS